MNDILVLPEGDKSLVYFGSNNSISFAPNKKIPPEKIFGGIYFAVVRWVGRRGGVCTLARICEGWVGTLGGNFFGDADHFSDASLEGFFKLACFVDAGE